MAIPFLAQVELNAGADFKRTQALNMRLQNLGSAPSSPTAGLIYFDSGAGYARFHTGSGWVVVKDTWVAEVTGSGCVTVGGTTAAPELSIEAANGSDAGSMSAAHYTLVNAAVAANTANTLVKRDGSGNFSAGTITANLNGNASTVTTNADLTGDVTSSGNATTISAGIITNSMVHATAGIALSKLAGVTGNRLVVSNGSGVLVASANFSIDGSGNLDLGNKRITGVANGTAATDAINLSQLDSAKAGLDVKASVRAATTAALSGYTVSSGVLTASSNGTLSADGVTMVAGNRLLVKNETGGNAKYNGIYDVTSAGGGGSAFVLTRSDDADSDAEVTTGCFTFVSEGTVNATTSWVLSTPDDIVLGTTDLSFTQYAGAGSVTAGNGISVSGNQVTAVGTTNRISIGAGIDIDANYVGQASITTLGTITTGTWSGTTIALNKGGTGSTTASGARTNLGLVIGTDVQAYSSVLSTYAGINPSSNVQTLLGAANYAAFRSSLGVAIGTDVQAYDAELAAIAGLTSAANKLPYFTGSGTAALASFTPAGFSLTLSANTTIGGTNTGDQTITLTGDVTGSGVGSFSATISAGAVTLAKMAALAANTILGNNTGSSATPIAMTVTQTKALLGLGTLAVQDASSVSITGGTITGITDLAIADGGTGASNAVDARANLAVMARYAATAEGDDVTTSFDIVHNLATRDVIVSVIDSTTYAVVMADVVATDTNTVSVNFSVAPASGTDYRVVVAAIG